MDREITWDLTRDLGSRNARVPDPEPGKEPAMKTRIIAVVVVIVMQAVNHVDAQDQARRTPWGDPGLEESGPMPR